MFGLHNSTQALSRPYGFSKPYGMSQPYVWKGEGDAQHVRFGRRPQGDRIQVAAQPSAQPVSLLGRLKAGLNLTIDAAQANVERTASDALIQPPLGLVQSARLSFLA